MHRQAFAFALATASLLTGCANPPPAAPGGAADAAVDSTADITGADSAPADLASTATADTSAAGADSTPETATAPDTAAWPEVFAPDLPPDQPISEFYVTIRTGDGPNDGSSDPYDLCLSPDTCFKLDNKLTPNRQIGSVDHYRLAGAGLTKASRDRVVLAAKNGNNAWSPTCVAVVADGELLFCQDNLKLKLSLGGGSELPKWQAADPGLKACASCYPTGALTYGPMVGHTSSGELRVWSQVASALPVQLEVSSEPKFVQPIAGPPLLPAQSHAFAQVAAAPSLQPDTPYWYRLKIGGTVAYTSTTPVRTAPAAAGKLSFAFGSCAKFDDQPIFAAIAAAKPSGYLSLGDAHYANTADLDALRWWYRKMHSEAHFLALGQQVPMWAIWDDHDYTSNNADGKAPGKDTALQVFNESWANPSAGSDGAAGIWTSMQFGDADLFLLDDRYWRNVQGDMLGTVQTQWLIGQLKASKAKFKIIGCGSQWTLFSSGDSWAAYPAAQKALLAAIFTAKVGGVVLLSGDVHRSEVRRIVNAGPGKYPLYEFTASPLANVASLCKPKDAETLFCYSGNSFGLLAIDSTVAPAKLTYQLRDEQGKTLYELSVTEAELQVAP